MITVFIHTFHIHNSKQHINLNYSFISLPTTNLPQHFINSNEWKTASSLLTAKCPETITSLVSQTTNHTNKNQNTQTNLKQHIKTQNQHFATQKIIKTITINTQKQQKHISQKTEWHTHKKNTHPTNQQHSTQNHTNKKNINKPNHPKTHQNITNNNSTTTSSVTLTD